MRKTSSLSFNRSSYGSVKYKQRRQQQIALGVVFGLCGLLMAIPLVEAKYGRGLAQRTVACLFHKNSRQTTGYQSNKSVFSLAGLPPDRRAAELEAIANGGSGRESARARYMLASDLIQQQQGQKAAQLLEGLECNYSLLGAHAIAKRAQAYQVMGDQAKATAEWENLLKYYPDTPVALEALYALGKKKPDDWKKAIEKYPSHPRTLEMARSWLEDNPPNQRDLLLLLARYSFDQPGVSTVLDRLVSLPDTINGKPLKPIDKKDWEAIAKGYWRDRKYGQASAAYAKSEATSRNAYLMARGLELAEKPRDANQAYKKLVQDFPKAEETGKALIQIARIEPSIEAVPYLDQAIENFPDSAGEALLEKAETLKHLDNPAAARETRQLLLTKYSNSDAAAAYRWEMAQASAKAGDIQGALQWAKPILDRNPHSEQAREAGFWAGKWAIQLGQQEQAKAAFQQVIALYPYSYYAWRSAVFLGWDVGDFSTARQMSAEIVQPEERPELPTGSALVQELYQLGQEQDAWMQWQAEFQKRLEPTVDQRFTNGLLRLLAGEYLAGIEEIYSIGDKDNPSERAEYEALQKKPIYWYALYPLPYLQTIETWSQKRKVNPLLVLALMRQESRFMPTIRSRAGAVGLMQMMPPVAASIAKQIDVEEYSLENTNDNINLGVALLASDHSIFSNNSLLALASYNAGAGNVRQWVNQKPLTDPDEFVESIPFPETKDYVKQVFGNYWNYLRLYHPKVSQLVAQK